MSGIPRDFPPALLFDWPNSMRGAGLPHYVGRPIPTEREIFDAIQSFPLSNDPYSPPLYSNTGYAILGMAAVAAHRAHAGQAETFTDLIRRDIFEPLGMNGTSFLVTAKNRGRAAVASYESHEIVGVRLYLLLAMLMFVLAGCGHRHDESVLWTGILSGRPDKTHANIPGFLASRKSNLSV